MIETVESAIARLQAEEAWPFHDEQSGCLIKEDLYYGFGDSGSMWGRFDGYLTPTYAEYDIRKDQGDDQYGLLDRIGHKPEDLGDCAVTILSGREFVDRLYYVSNYDKEQFSDFGHWS